MHRLRLGVFLGSEKRIATPYYGRGNSAAYDPSREGGENPYYYRYGRERNVVRLNVQRRMGDLPLSLLAGAQVAQFRIDPTPKNEGMTLLVEELGPGAPIPGGFQNSIRVGLVWDTRDAESGPKGGVWAAALVERVDEALGSEDSYTRWTFTDRRYLRLAQHWVLANRFTLQNVTGNPPFYALTYVQSSFGESEALGGSGSVRGVLRNRYAGEGLFLWNLELRWRAKELRIIGKVAHVGLVGFLDSGRVWENGVRFSSLATELHHGAGGGIRVGLGPNFVIATDVAGSPEAGAQTYIGLGYLF
jgi:outer membrane protein assembly factor BamA